MTDQIQTETTIRFYGLADSLRAWRTVVAQRTGKTGGRIATDSGRDFFDIDLSAQARESLMEDWRAESTTGGATAQGRPFRWNECVTFEEIHGVPDEALEHLARIAHETLGIETLETRGASWLDRHVVAVWGVLDALRRAYELGAASAGAGWNKIQSDEDLPPQPVPVMAFVKVYEGKTRILRAAYARERQLELHEDADGGDYDEETGEYWADPGWYEWNEFEECHWAIDGDVTHWMPLPEGPEPRRPTDS